MANTKVTGDLIASSTIATGNIADNAVTSAKISGITTAHITEGSNLYYTDARARASVSVSGNALSYNSSTGVITSNFEEAPTFTGNVIINTSGQGLKISTAAGQSHLQFTDSTNSKNAFINYNNDVLKYFSHGPVERLRIDSSGNIGIGTTSPSSRLHVNSGSTNIVAQFESTDGTGGIMLKDSTGNVELTTSATNGFNVQPAGGTAAFVVTGSGNVGIGTTSPTVNKLQVEGSTDGLGIAIKNTGTGGRIYGIQSTGGTSGYGQGKLAFVDEAVGARMVIDSSGNVGIGTTSPSSKLSISGSQAAIDITRGIAGDSKWEFSSDSTALYFSEMSTGTRAYMMTIKETTGNVGIGTTSPSAAAGTALAIYGGVSQSRLALKNSATGDGANDGLQIGVGTDAGAFIEQRENNYLILSTNAIERMRIDSSGNVGIGIAPVSGARLTLGTGAVANEILSFAPASAGNAELRNTSSTGTFTFTNSDGSSEKMRITSGGAVRIGTTTYPDNEKLTVAGGITVSSGTYNFLALRLDSNNSIIESKGQYQNLVLNATGASGSAIFKTADTERMRIDSSGNVGIGTTTPSVKLEVSDGVNASQTAVINLNGNNGAAAELVMRAGGNDGGTIYNRRAAIRYYSNQISTTTAQWVNGVSMTQATGDDNFYFNNSGNSTVLKLTQASEAVFGGNIYLPQSPGAIQGTGYPYTTYLGSGANATTTYIQAGSTFKTEIKLVGGDVGDFINFTAGNTERMRITSAGNVGIGTTSPDGSLHVVGKVNTNRIVSGNLIMGNIRSNLTTTTYLLLVDLNVSAGFSLVGEINAASYTTYNVSRIYVRKNYNATTGAAVITGIAKSGSNLSVVDISHSSGRFIAIKLTGDPEIDVMWTGYRLNEQFNSDGTIKILTSGVTENSVYASY